MTDLQTEFKTHYQAAVNAHRQNDLPSALEHYQRALALHDGVPAIHNNVAAIHLAQGATAEAEAAWRRALAYKPDYAEAHYNIAVLLSEKGEAVALEEAAAHCTLALEHKEEYVQAHHLMGNILVSQRRQDEARRAYAAAEGLAAVGRSSTDQPVHSMEQLPAGVEVGHLQRVPLGDGRVASVTTMAMRPLILRVDGFLDDAECDAIIGLARPRLQAGRRTAPSLHHRQRTLPRHENAATRLATIATRHPRPCPCTGVSHDGRLQGVRALIHLGLPASRHRPPARDAAEAAGGADGCAAGGYTAL